MNPNDTFVLYVLGNLEGAVGDAGRAIDLCHEILRLNPRDNRIHRIYTLLAFACVAAKRWVEGAAWAARSVNDAPRNWPGHSNLVSCLVGMGEIEKAKAALQRARELFPDRVERYITDGRSSHGRAEIVECTRVFRRIAAGLEDPSAAATYR